MTITLSAFSGTHTVSTTEWSMTTDTAGPDTSTATGIFQAYLDMSAMSGSDVFQLNIYEKVLSGGSQVLITSATFSGVPAISAAGSSIGGAVTPALTLGIGWDMTLKKIQGTDRSISWHIAQVA